MKVVQPWPATSDGLDPVMALMAAGFSPDYGERWSRAQLANLLAGDPNSWLAGAHDGDRLAGFALTRVVPDAAELMLLAVDPALRRRAVGRTLLDAVTLEAGRRGAARLFVEVRDGNAALDFYAALDFRPIGRRPGYYRDRAGGRFDALTLERTVN